MKCIRIVSKVDGFRRAGITHTGVAEHPLERFTKAQLEQLHREPNLVVQEIEMPDPDEDGEAAASQPAQVKAGKGKPPTQ